MEMLAAESGELVVWSALRKKSTHVEKHQEILRLLQNLKVWF